VNGSNSASGGLRRGVLVAHASRLSPVRCEWNARLTCENKQGTSAGDLHSRAPHRTSDRPGRTSAAFRDADGGAGPSSRYSRFRKCLRLKETRPGSRWSTRLGGRGGSCDRSSGTRGPKRGASAASSSPRCPLVAQADGKPPHPRSCRFTSIDMTGSPPPKRCLCSELWIHLERSSPRMARNDSRGVATVRGERGASPCGQEFKVRLCRSPPRTGDGLKVRSEWVADAISRAPPTFAQTSDALVLG